MKKDKPRPEPPPRRIASKLPFAERATAAAELPHIHQLLRARFGRHTPSHSSPSVGAEIARYHQAMRLEEGTDVSLQDSALLLMEGILRGGGRVDALDLRIALSLYDASLRDHGDEGAELVGKGSEAAAAAIQMLYTQLMLQCQDDLSGEHALQAARLLADQRIRGPVARAMLRRCVQPLRQLCRAGVEARLGQQAEATRRKVLRAWHGVVCGLLQDGATLRVVVPQSSSSSSGGGGGVGLIWSEDSVILGEFLLLLAEYGDGRSLLPLCTKMRENAASCAQRMQTKAQETPRTTRIPFLDPRQVTAILEKLVRVSHTHSRHAAMIFSLVPLAYRLPRHYEVLLSVYGQGRLLRDQVGREFNNGNVEVDAVSAALLSRASSADSAARRSSSSQAFQDALWTQANGHPAITRSQTRQLCLFNARMQSHMERAEVHMVFRDLQDMYARGLVKAAEVSGKDESAMDSSSSSSSSPPPGWRLDADAVAVAAHKLSYSAQVAIVKTLMVSGQWELGGQAAEKLMQDAPPTHRSHLLNAATEPLLLKAHQEYSADRTDAYLSLMTHFVDTLGLVPDAVTRNALLTALVRSSLPIVAGKSATQRRRDETQHTLEVVRIFDLFVQCGVLRRRGAADDSKQGHFVDGYRLASIKDPRHFLRFDIDVLKALVRLLFERGWADEAQRVLHLLKEGEKEAVQRTREADGRQRRRASGE